jgi:predicted nucleic acid-binding protein
MTKYFLDSNIFLRYLNKDEPRYAAAAALLFEKAKAGELELFCGPPVFFEIAWVLRSVYKIPNTLVLDTLESILSIPNLKVFDADYVSAAIGLAREKDCSFADSYIGAVALAGNLGVATFNVKHFGKLGVELYPLKDGAGRSSQHHTDAVQ